jgi:hypothetical protein
MIRPRRCSSTGACWMGFDSLTIDAAPVTPCWYGMVPSNRWIFDDRIHDEDHNARRIAN